MLLLFPFLKSLLCENQSLWQDTDKSFNGCSSWVFWGVTGSTVSPSPIALSARPLPKEWIVLYQRGKRWKWIQKDIKGERDGCGRSGALGVKKRLSERNNVGKKGHRKRVGGWEGEGGVSRDPPASGVQSDKSWNEEKEKKKEEEQDRDGRRRRVNRRAFVLEIDAPNRSINRSRYVSPLLSASSR